LLLRPFKTLPEPLFVPLLEEMAAPKPVPKVLLFTQALVFPKDRPCPGPLMLTGNGNVQLMVGSWDALELGADSNVAINGGTHTGSNTVEPAILINGDNAYVTSAIVQLLRVLYWLKLPKLFMPALPVPIPVPAPLLVKTQPQ